MKRKKKNVMALVNMNVSIRCCIVLGSILREYGTESFPSVVGPSLIMFPVGHENFFVEFEQGDLIHVWLNTENALDFAVRFIDLGIPARMLAETTKDRLSLVFDGGQNDYLRQ